MPIDQSVRESSVIGFRIFQTMLSDFCDTLLRLTQDKTVSISQKTVQAIFNSPETFQEKAVKIHDLLTENIKDPEQREYYLNQLDTLVDAEKSASQGIDSMIRFVRRSSHLSKETKDRLVASFSELKKTHQQTYARTVTESQYRQLVKILKERNLLGLSYEQASTIGRPGNRDTIYDQESRVLMMNNIHMLKSSDGLYHLIYEGSAMNEMMDLLIKQASLDYRVTRAITKDDYDAMRMARCENAATIADIKLEGLSPELAEKVIRQGEKEGTIMFVPEKQPDGTVTLYTDAGPQDSSRESKQARDEIYTHVTRILAGAAYSLTGRGGQYEEKRMRYYINRQNNLTKSLDDLKNSEPQNQKYFIMFPRVEKSEATHGRKHVFVDQFLVASKNSLAYVQSDGTQVQNLFKKPTDVIRNAEQIAARKNDFFILTDKDMSVFRKRATELNNNLSSIVSNLALDTQTPTAMQTMVKELRDQSLDIDKKLYDLKQDFLGKSHISSGDRSTYRAQIEPLEREKAELNSVIEYISDNNKLPNIPEIMDGIMSVHAERAMFKENIPKKDSRIIDAETQALYNGMQNLKKGPTITSEIMPEPYMSEEQQTISPKEVDSVFEQLKNDCISSLSEIAVPSGKTAATEEERNNMACSKWPVDKDAQGNITVRGVHEVEQIMDEHIKEAKQLVLDHIRISSRFLQPDLSVDLMNRTSSIEISRSLREEIKAMDQHTPHVAENEKDDLDERSVQNTRETADRFNVK